MSTSTTLRATDLGAQHIGQVVIVTYGNQWTIRGRLSEVTHRALDVIEPTLSGAHVIPGRQTVALEVGGFRTGDLDADLVEVR